MARAIVGLVSDIGDLEFIVSSLKVSGFRQSDISFLLPDNAGLRDVGFVKHSKAPEGMSLGVAFGAIIGGTIAWLAGEGTIFIPGFAQLQAIGPVFALMSGVSFGGTLGGIFGGLVGLGTPEYEAKQFSGKVNQDNILLSVHAENMQQARKAEAIFKNSDAKDIACIEETNVKHNC